MNKTLKNIIMVFTLLCIIFVIVFCVELFLLNRSSNRSPDPVVSTRDPDEPPDENLLTFDDPAPDDPFGLEDPFNDLIDDDRTGPAVTPPLTASRQSFLLSAGIAELVFFVDMELFERTDLGDGLFYSYLGDGNAGIEITFAFVHPQGGISAVADTWLHNYLDGADSTVEGERSIGRSPIRGTYVTGVNNNGETYSAWLRSLSDFESDSLALVVVVNYEDTMQSGVIYSILDTMFINMLNEPAE